MPALPRKPDMIRDQRRRTGAPPRARRRGRVPLLPLQRAPFGPLLGRRRCLEYPRPQSLRAAHRSRLRSGCGREMDRRRRDRGTRRSPRSDPPQSRPPRPARSDGRGEAFPCSPANEQNTQASPAPSNSPNAARRLFAAGRPIPGTQAEAYLRARGITGRLDWVALRFHPRVWYRETDKAPLEAWPALLAAVTDPGGRITGIQRTWLDRDRPDKAPIADPRRALGHLLGNGVRFGADQPAPRKRGSSSPARASRRCSRSNRSCPRCR